MATIVVDDVFRRAHPDKLVQCIVKQHRKKRTYKLSLGVGSTSPVMEGKFLLAARTIDRAFLQEEYIISSDDPEDIMSEGSAVNVVGKLWASMRAVKFKIYKRQYNDERSLNSTEVSAGQARDFKVGQVDYYGLYDGAAPLTMRCTLHTMDDEGFARPASTQLSATSFRMNDSFRSLGLLGYLQSKLTFRTSNARDLESTRSLLLKEDKPLVLVTNAPWQNEGHEALSLKFGATNTLASLTNFQLVFATEPNPPNQHKIIFQFRKIGEDMFAMDYRYPLSAFEAFAVGVSRCVCYPYN